MICVLVGAGSVSLSPYSLCVCVANEANFCVLLSRFDPSLIYTLCIPFKFRISAQIPLKQILCVCFFIVFDKFNYFCQKNYLNCQRESDRTLPIKISKRDTDLYRSNLVMAKDTSPMSKKWGRSLNRSVCDCHTIGSNYLLQLKKKTFQKKNKHSFILANLDHLDSHWSSHIVVGLSKRCPL